MFHRPKAEDQNTNVTATDKTEKAANETAEKAASDLKKDQTQTPAQPAEVKSQTESQTQSQSNSKENKTMINTPKADNAADSKQDNENAARPMDIPGTAAAFQRPGAGPQNSPARMPGSSYSPGSTYSGAPASPYGSTNNAAENNANGRRLVVGEGITMSGEIECCDTLIVEGTIEAALKGASVLDIAQTGVFYGTVEIDECTIAGRFEGDLTVHGRLTVKSTGSITGSIAYKELAVDAGATVDGKLSPLSANGASKKTERKDGKDNKGSKAGQKHDNGGELFAGQATAAE